MNKLLKKKTKKKFFTLTSVSFNDLASLVSPLCLERSKHWILCRATSVCAQGSACSC